MKNSETSVVKTFHIKMLKDVGMAVSKIRGLYICSKTGDDGIQQ